MRPGRMNMGLLGALVAASMGDPAMPLMRDNATPSQRIRNGSRKIEMRSPAPQIRISSNVPHTGMKQRFKALRKASWRNDFAEVQPGVVYETLVMNPEGGEVRFLLAAGDENGHICWLTHEGVLVDQPHCWRGPAFQGVDARTPLNVWLETLRFGENGTNVCRLYVDDDLGGWVDREGRTTITHHSFAAPTYWRPLP